MQSTRLATWPASQGPTRSLFLLLAAVFTIVGLVLMVGYAVVPHQANDFYAFRSYARFIRINPPFALYDKPRLALFQHLPGHKLFAFMYDPVMLLLVWPLAWLPSWLGYALWIGLGLAVCAAAVAGSRKGWPFALMVLIAPSTIWTALCGQSSLLVGGLLIGGLRLSRSRPWIAGLLIGLATYKPQLGLLVPVALLASGAWRTMLAACLTALCLVGLSALGFGTATWAAWFHHIPSIVAVRTDHATDWATLFVTVASDLVLLGIATPVADAAQLVSAALMLPPVYWCFHQGRHRGDAGVLLPAAALGAATFLATPFAFIYDLPLFTAALLLFMAERRESGAPFQFAEMAILVAGLLLPWLMLASGLHYLGIPLVLLTLCMVMRRIAALRRIVPAGAMA